MPNTFQKYGLAWPLGTTNYAIEKWCFRNGHTAEAGGLGPYGHFKEAIRAAFRQDQFNYNSFVDLMVKDFFIDDKCLVWGSAGAGKSTAAAVIALIYFDSAPKDTTVTLYTTSLSKHDLRAFGEIIKYHSILKKNFPDTASQYMPSSNKIVYDDPEDGKNTEKKGGIFAFGTANAEDVRKANAQSGVHNKYNFRIIDEMNACDASIMGPTSLSNFFMSGEESKVMGLANPHSWDDNMGKFSIPVEGIDSISPETGSWKTTTGFHVRHLNILNCPRYTEPNGEKKYSHFPARHNVEKVRTTFGEDSLAWYQQVLGFMAPSRFQFDTVLTRAMAEQYGVRDHILFKNIIADVASFDPASTQGGDRKILTFARLGMTHEGKTILQIDEQIDLKVAVSKKEEFTMAMAKEVIKQCQERDISKDHLGVDASGTDGVSDTLDILWQQPGSVYRCYFTGKPTNRRVSMDDVRPRKEVYDRRVTELWMNVREFCQAGQLKGMTEDSLKQFCSRKLESRYGKFRIEAKHDMTVSSPDCADSVCVMLDMCIEHFGFESSLPIYGKKKNPYYHKNDEDQIEDPFMNVDSNALFSEDTLREVSVF